MADRSSGVLLPVFSLAGPYGIGDFGLQARTFAASLAQAGFTSWQVLPFTPTGYGNSPYQGYSAYAGNPLFISPDMLADRGLLTREECQSAQYAGDPGHIDYHWLEASREPLLRCAYRRLGTEDRQQIKLFVEREKAWIEDYALFRVIKRSQEDKPWWAWTDDLLRRANPLALTRVRKQSAEEIQYWYFVEYEFNRQWRRLKEDLSLIGIEIIGDIPIYVSADSSDVWANKQYFELDAQDCFTRVAGVPPDYFTADGQLWGNPLYDWPVHAAENYDWWVRRIKAGLTTFDYLRIDHFRGFESYWAVPFGETTARKGQWNKGPAMKLFERLLAEFPDASIIAEDLGDIDDEVRHFLRQTGLPGMKVLQFSFDPASDADNRPHQYPRHCVAYSGTHDNTTLAGWLSHLDPLEKALIKDYCGDVTCEAVLRCLWMTGAERIIVPAQDLIGLGSDARINIPGTMSGNWRFRLTDTQIDQIEFDRFYRLNTIFGRCPIHKVVSCLSLHDRDE
ncbi:MAG: 4-alpha-glucanotransferase [Bacillota bacterium]|nr:4-alpha-glucanotransferase [Bacillota bacterium]